MKFADWWHYHGSGIIPKEHEDMEEFAKRIAANAFEAGKLSGLSDRRVICGCGDEYNADSCQAVHIMQHGKCLNCDLADSAGDA
jgi:hypothetical protein